MQWIAWGEHFAPLILLEAHFSGMAKAAVLLSKIETASQEDLESSCKMPHSQPYTACASSAVLAQGGFASASWPTVLLFCNNRGYPRSARVSACNFRSSRRKNPVRRDAEHHTRRRVCSPDLSPRQFFQPFLSKCMRGAPGAMAVCAVVAQGQGLWTLAKALFLVDSLFGKFLTRTALAGDFGRYRLHERERKSRSKKFHLTMANQDLSIRV